MFSFSRLGCGAFFLVECAISCSPCGGIGLLGVGVCGDASGTLLQSAETLQAEDRQRAEDEKLERLMAE